MTIYSSVHEADQVVIVRSSSVGQAGAHRWTTIIVHRGDKEKLEITLHHADGSLLPVHIVEPATSSGEIELAL